MSKARYSSCVDTWMAEATDVSTDRALVTVDFGDFQGGWWVVGANAHHNSSMYTPHVADTDACGPLAHGRQLAEGQSGRCERLRGLIRLDLRRRGAGGLLHLRDEPIAPLWALGLFDGVTCIGHVAHVGSGSARIAFANARA